MKTKTLLLLCFIAAFSVNPVNAQKGVDKEEFTNPVAFTLECTGDFIYGEVVYLVFFTPQGWVEKVRKATLIGYEDASLAVPTDRVYELSQCDNGKMDGTRGVLTAIIKLEGKIIAINHRSWQITTNANGKVTVDFLKDWWECK